MGEPRVILMERVEEISGDKDMKWWMENMPPTAKYTPTVRYRKVGARSLDIFNVIEIIGNKKECIIEFYNEKTIVVQGSFAVVYEAWIKAEEFDEDEYDEGDLIL